MFLLCLSLLIIAVAPSPGGAATRSKPEKHPRFEHLTTEEGLSYSNVYGILQDRQGFMWFATKYGLNRFDGMDVKVHTHEPEDPHSLSGNYVWSLHEESGGAIWVTTWGAGLNRFDPATETFVSYRHDPGDPRTLNSDFLWWAHVDGNGRLWVGTEAGLDRLDRRTGTFAHHVHDPDDPSSLSHNAVSMITEDQWGFLWIATFGGGLNRFDPRSGRFLQYRRQPEGDSSLSHDQVFSVLIDHRNILWVGTQAGLNRLDLSSGPAPPGDGAFVRYFHDPEDSSSLGHNRVRALHEDRSGTLWVGTTGGLNRYNREDDTFTRYRADNARPGALLNDSVYFIQEDASGALWVATANGVSKSDPDGQRFDLLMSGSDVQAVHEDDSGILWVGTGESGLNRIDRTGGRTPPARGASKDPLDLSGKIVKRILPAEDGWLWIATLDGGLNRCRPATGDCRHYRHAPNDPESLGSDAILDIALGAEGGLWIATSDSGLDRYDPEGEAFTHYTQDRDNPNSLISDWCRSLHLDSKGHLWIGTEAGLSRMETEGGTFRNHRAKGDDPTGLSNGVVNMVHEDRRGTLWIATNGGLNRLNPGAGTFTVYRRSHGLPGNSISAILEDDRGNLWLSTNNGLSRFDPFRETFRNYDRLDGLQGRQFIYHSAFKSPSGELFFGGSNGLNAFYPDRLADNPHVPPVHLTDFRLFNRSVPIGGDSPLHRQIRFTDHLVLTHEQSVFSFAFAALNYRAPEKNRYAYKMEGFDKDWTHTDSRHRIAKYTNLDPGDYRFRVKGSNNDGLWNQEGAAVAVTILPPWWETGWFRIIVLVMGLVLLFSGYRWRLGIIERQRRILAQQVRERTAALEQQQLELRENEEKYRGLVEGIDEVIYRMSLPDGTYEYISPAVETVFGYPAAAYYENPLFIRTIIHPDFRAYFQEEWSQLLAGRISPTYEYKIIDRDGGERWILQSNKGLFDDEGHIVAVEGLCRNITDFKQSQEDQKKAKETAEAANNAKSEFLANMSHEIRTPMNAVLGFSEILLGEVDDPRQKAYLTHIHGSGKTLLSLINDILDLSKIESGHLELEVKPVDIRRLMDEIASLFFHSFEKKGIDFRSDVSRDFPGTVHVDELRIRQICINLIGNALKFTRSGYVKASVFPGDPNPEAGREECGRRLTLGIQVEDTGIGIPEDQQELVFESFQQRKGQESSQFSGTGLGLAITRRLVELMRGTITVRSRPGEGSVFRVTLPDIEWTPSIEAHRDVGLFQGGTVRFRPARILIIDDAPMNRALLGGYLEDTGLSWVEAENGEHALALMKTGCVPDLILMDLRMPGLDGFETTDMIRRDDALAGVPILACTAAAMKDEREGAAGMFDGHLTKPLNRPELLSELRRFLPLETPESAPCAHEPGTGGRGIGHAPPRAPRFDPEGLRPSLHAVRDRILSRMENLDVYFIDEILDLAQEVRSVAEETGMADLGAFADRLEQAANAHRVDEVDHLLSHFRQVFETLE